MLPTMEGALIVLVVAIVGFACSVVIWGWTGSPYRSGAEWAERFEKRHGHGARLLLGAMAGAICLLFAMAVDFTYRAGTEPILGVGGAAILGSFMYRYVRHRVSGG